MYELNLLPWREARREQRQRRFVYTMVTTAAGALLLVLLANQVMNQRIDNQNARNRYLSSEIRKLDQQIATIEDLKKQRQRLLDRKSVIEELQLNRTLMVHLFHELAVTAPEGLRLTRVQQQGQNLVIEGMTQSNARVSNYLRNIEASEWLHEPELVIIQEVADAPPDQPFLFRLRTRLASPQQADPDQALVSSERFSP